MAHLPLRFKARDLTGTNFEVQTKASFYLADVNGRDVDGILSYQWCGCRKIIIDADENCLIFKSTWIETGLVKMYLEDRPPVNVFQVKGIENAQALRGIPTPRAKELERRKTEYVLPLPRVPEPLPCILPTVGPPTNQESNLVQRDPNLEDGSEGQIG